MVPLIWTEPARNDLESIFGYFNAISTKVAIHYSEEFIKAGDRLKIFPEMGPLEPPKPLNAMKEQKHSICYMILPEGIREDLDEGLKALSEKHAKDKRMATVKERSVAAAQILESKTNAAVSFELVEGIHFSPILPRLEKALTK